MASNRFYLGGFALGEAVILNERQMNAAAAFSKAAGQFALGGTNDASRIASDCRAIAAGLPQSASKVSSVLQDAQRPKSRPEYHAVSAGWLMGTVYGSCRHGLGHSVVETMIQYVKDAGSHGEAMAALGHLRSWKAGDVSQSLAMSGKHFSMSKTTIRRRPSRRKYSRSAVSLLQI